MHFPAHTIFDNEKGGENDMDKRRRTCLGRAKTQRTI